MIKQRRKRKKSPPIYNLRKDLRGKFDQNHCLALDKNLKDKILSQLKTYKIETEKVRVESISDFLSSISLNTFKLEN